MIMQDIDVTLLARRASTDRNPMITDTVPQFHGPGYHIYREIMDQRMAGLGGE